MVVLPRKGGTGETNVTTRFLSPLGIEMRPQIHIIQGRWFTPGQREVVVSSSINKRFEHANIGDSVHIGKGDWPIVGIFDASGTAHDSEIWGDINQLVTDFERSVYSSVLVRATDPVSAQALKNRANDDQRLELNGLLEPDYYASQTKSGGPIKVVGWIVAFIMAVGSCFAAANTMYAAVAYRGREIATLRVIGFSRPSILTSFMLESLLLSLLGATLGIILMLPFNGMTTGTQNQVTFSEVVFSLQMTPAVVMSAVIFALIMGVVGGFAPAWHASRRDISERVAGLGYAGRSAGADAHQTAGGTPALHKHICRLTQNTKTCRACESIAPRAPAAKASLRSGPAATSSSGSRCWCCWDLVAMSYRLFSHDAPEVEVVRASAQSSDVGGVVLSASGYIVAHHKINLNSKVTGRVKWIGVEKGDKVKEGQVLVRLEDDEFRAQYEQAEGAAQNAQAYLEELQNGSRPEEIQQAQHNLDEARATLVNDKITLDRTRGLVTEGVLSKQALDDATAKFEADQQRVNSLDKGFQLAKIGPRQEEIARARGALQQAQGQADYAKSLLDATVIRAPVTGTILERAAEKGRARDFGIRQHRRRRSARPGRLPGRSQRSPGGTRYRAGRFCPAQPQAKRRGHNRCLSRTASTTA